MRLRRAELFRLAADANVDPRTVLRVLRGEKVRGDAGERVRAVLAAHGVKLEPAPATP